MIKERNSQLVTIWIVEVVELTEHLKKLNTPLESQFIERRDKERIDELVKRAEKLIKEVQGFLDEKKDVENFTIYLDQLIDINERLARFHPRVH
jgi:hypothetical protein